MTGQDHQQQQQQQQQLSNPSSATAATAAAPPRRFVIPSTKEIDQRSQQQLTGSSDNGGAAADALAAFRRREVNNEQPAANQLQAEQAKLSEQASTASSSFARPTSTAQQSTASSASATATPATRPNKPASYHPYQRNTSTFQSQANSGNSAWNNQYRFQQQRASATNVQVSSDRSHQRTIVVNSNQRGNPLLKSITGIPWEYGDIVPDYQVGNTSCVLFLSLRYHQLHPDYIYSRITKLGSQFVLRILLCLIDADDHREVLKELSRACIAADLTLVCCWSNEEAGRWVESFKAYEFHSADQIKEKVDNNYLSRVTKSLTKIRSINKDNVATLLTTFGSFKNIANAPKDELEQCIGLGPQRVNRLMQAFNQPFTSNKSLRRNTQTQLMLTGTGLSIAPPSNQSGATSSKGDGEQTETRSKFF